MLRILYFPFREHYKKREAVDDGREEYENRQVDWDDGRNCLQAIYMKLIILPYDKIEKEVKIQYNTVGKVTL